MRILIDVNHPAHVHYFRNFYGIMKDKGHEVFFVSRDKEMAHRLFKLFKIPFENRGKGKNGSLGKFYYLLYADWMIYKLAKTIKPDLFLNFLHPYPSHVAKLMGRPSLVFSDTEHAKLHHSLTVPYSDKVFTPACFSRDLGNKHVRFPGYMELAYLHPNYFTPNPEILNILGIMQGEKYVIFRFVSWEAAHDKGQSGISLSNKVKMVNELLPFAKVFISSENELPANLEQYRINIPVDKIHDAIYYSSLMFGESGTMSSEAAVLGTPAIFINSLRLGYLEEQEKKYNLVNNFRSDEASQQQAIARAVEILSDGGKEEYFKERRARLLEDSIDTTQFMVSQVLGYQKQ